jgi:uncharacterized OB-fold protein
MAGAAPRQRPLPIPTKLTKPFWDAIKQGKFMLQYDPASSSYQFWPRSYGMNTGNPALEWREAKGTGTLYSYTETLIPAPGFEGKVPYLIGLIELDEGVRVMANLVNVEADQIKIGQRMKVAFEKLTDEVDYFAFEPA